MHLASVLAGGLPRGLACSVALLVACGGAPAPAPTPPAAGAAPAPPPATSAACVPTGCSGTVCAEADDGRMTTCEFKPAYACYRDAVCERQPDGACGWTETKVLSACLNNPPAM